MIWVHVSVDMVVHDDVDVVVHVDVVDMVVHVQAVINNGEVEVVEDVDHQKDS